jgi:hypothetical protein
MLRRRGSKPLKPDGHEVSPPSQCVRCGYSLDGIADDAACPECGAPGLLARQGTLLAMAGLPALHDLERGARLLYRTLVLAVAAPVVLALGAGVLSMAGSGRLSSGNARWLGLLLAGVAVAVVLGWTVGWTRVARACGDPGLMTGSSTARLVAVHAGRAFAFSAVLLTLLASLVHTANFSIAPVVGRVLAVLAAGTWLAGAGAGLRMCREIVARTNDLGARRRSTQLLALTAAVVLGLLPFVAMPLRGRAGLVSCSFVVLTVAGFVWLAFAAVLMSTIELEALRAARIRRSLASEPDAAGTL